MDLRPRQESESQLDDSEDPTEFDTIEDTQPSQVQPGQDATPGGLSTARHSQCRGRGRGRSRGPANPLVQPAAPGQKSTQKRKHSSPIGTAKRPPSSVQDGTATTASPDSAVLLALANIQSSITSINTRIQALEDRPSQEPPAPVMPPVPVPLTVPALPSASVYSQPGPLLSDTIPKRTLATAVPVSTGAPFFTPSAAISHQLRSQILAGNDVNLVKILLSSELCDRRTVDCGDVSVILKDGDPRLAQSLTLAEFNVAFGVYRDVICEVYPSCRAELDTYLAIISDLALSYRGLMFYDYHRSFSAKAASFIQRFNQRLDWSVADLSLISRHFTGHHTLACSLCGSRSHSTHLCTKVAQPQPKPGTSGVLDHQVTAPSSTPLCYNFNENVCKFHNCRYLHVCSYCGDSHPKSVCPRRARFVKKEKK